MVMLLRNYKQVETRGIYSYIQHIKGETSYEDEQLNKQEMS